MSAPSAQPASGGERVPDTTPMLSNEAVEEISGAYEGIDKVQITRAIYFLGAATWRAQLLEISVGLLVTLHRVLRRTASEREAAWEQELQRAQRMTLGKMLDELRGTGREHDLVEVIEAEAERRNELMHRFVLQSVTETLSTEGWRLIGTAVQDMADKFKPATAMTQSRLGALFSEAGIENRLWDDEVRAWIHRKPEAKG